MGAKLQSSSRATRASTRRLPPQKQAGIQAFTKATKSSATVSDAKDASSSRKRKVDEIEISIIGSSSNGGQESCDDYTRTTARATKAAKLSRTPARLSTSLTTPSTISKSLTPSNSNTLSEQPPSDDNNNDDDDDDTDDRPQSFYDLTNLHSSFLTALSLHYSHNGRNTPADLNQLLPSTEKIWKKRKVEKEDIQRVLYILDKGCDKGSGVSFRIANYGIGKTCLEIVGANRPVKQFGPPFDEAELIARFGRNLEETWRKSVVENSGSNQQQSPDFARNIPLVLIHDSTDAFTSLRIGQQRLLDLKKKGIIGLKTAEPETEHGERAASARGSNGTAGRRSGLLQRIQNKQLRQTTLAPPLSKEAILRRSAANLVEDVIGILILMRPSSTSPLITSGYVSSKKPYKFDTIVQNIRDSLRSAISKQEIEACLDLLAQPSVAGDWIDIITVNRLKSVVLRSGRDISPQEICMKVAHIKA
ncbi:hypothetical protein FQN50_004731 [Emmonsiellopsis sp. PD_5]|nr:hypothetical protein FQN50_004731 [Emmonsiellopsis sp. PD_5]